MPLGFVQLSQISSKCGRYQEALKWASRITSSTTKDIDILKGDIYFRLGKSEETKRHYEKSLSKVLVE